MMTPITSAPSSALIPFIGSGDIKAAPAKSTPEADTIRLNKEFVALLQRMWEIMAKEQGSRTATIGELFAVTNALKHIRDTAGVPGTPISTALYDTTTVTLDPRSPASAGKEGVQTMSLWNVMITYGICKEGDTKPVNDQQLKALIDHVENSNSGISGIAETRALELKRVVSSRDQAMLMDGNLVSQLAKTLMAIIRLM